MGQHLYLREEQTDQLSWVDRCSKTTVINVVDGALTATAGGSQVATQPVNTAGEALTRFDIRGYLIRL